MKLHGEIRTTAQIIRTEFATNKTKLLTDFSKSFTEFREFVFQKNDEYNTIQGFHRMSNVWNGRVADTTLNDLIKEFISELKEKASCPTL